jgi:hypothetical protein
MNIDFLEEPELEFGNGGKHPDIRRGLELFGPLDAPAEGGRRIRVGIVGTSETVDRLRRWLERCANGLEAKVSKQPNLFPVFPGFGPQSPFRAELEIDDSLCRLLSIRDVKETVEKSHYAALIGAVELLAREIRSLNEDHRPDVILVALPEELVGLDETEDSAVDSDVLEPPDITQSARAQERDEVEYGSDLDLHHMLKAEVMKFGQPIQVLLPDTYNPQAKTRAGKDGKGRLQDEATRAWNVLTALYYKANHRPWRIPRNPADLKTCFVGVNFYRSLDRTNLMTSMAQVYDERGEGVIVRGKPVQLAKDDPIPHLSEQDAFDLVSYALKEYRREHKHPPARLVMHKSSRYDEAEMRGFDRAVDSQDLETADFLVVGAARTRLFRNGNYPPLRGRFLSLDPRHHVLYTRGSVPYYSTYPGMYVPRPLKFQIARGETSPRKLAEEILGLTKLNWNNTQFDGGEPITMRVARQVGKVLKYVGTEGGIVQPRYSFYM